MMSKSQDYKIQELERKVTGVQGEVTKLNRKANLTQAELTEYKKKTDMRIRNLEIRDAVIARGIPAKDVAKEFGITNARVSQIVNKAVV
jgi:DNA-directed RNA polymerase specialized sigma subunit